MKNLPLWLLPIFLLFFASGCAQNDVAKAETDYEETKKMVVDILKTDDGKKALKEVMADDAMKETLILDQQVVSDTIEKAMTSEKGTEFWKKAFEDPKFAESVAQSMRKEHENLIKSLMKDPEYQGMMLELMKNPEMEEQLTTVLKSKEYREHLQSVMTETFESPLFKAKIQDILLKAAAEQASDDKKEEGK